MKEVKITCPKNHRFTKRIEEEKKNILKRTGRSALFCPECKVQITNVICDNCGKCVLPFSPCEKCEADPLVSRGPC